MDPSRVTGIYEEIGKFVIELEADPSVLGVKYLNELISRCRNYLNRVSLILGEIGREKRDVASHLRAQEAAYKVEFDETLANDERVKRLPNITDRTATVNMLLRQKWDAVESLKRDLEDLEYIEKAVKHRHNELKSTNTDIKMQRQMVRDELDTGSFYGDETNGRTNPPPPARRTSTDDLDEADIDAILKGNSIAGPLLVDDIPVKLDDRAPVIEAAKPVEAVKVAELGSPKPQGLPEQLTDEEAIQAFFNRPISAPKEDVDLVSGFLANFTP